MYRYYGTELYHYGVQGRSGRYKWGSGGRPYQRLEKPKRKVGLIKRIKSRNVEKQRLEKEKEEKKAAEEREKLKAAKEKILTKGTASEVLEYKNKIGLTNQEMKDALDRIRTTDDLRKYAAKDIKTGWDTMNNTAKKIKDVNVLTSAGIDAYRNLKTIMQFIDEASKETKKSKGS